MFVRYLAVVQILLGMDLWGYLPCLLMFVGQGQPIAPISTTQNPAILGTDPTGTSWHEFEQRCPHHQYKDRVLLRSRWGQHHSKKTEQHR